jgi:hypothetical protein
MFDKFETLLLMFGYDRSKTPMSNAEGSLRDLLEKTQKRLGLTADDMMESRLYLRKLGIIHNHPEDDATNYDVSVAQLTGACISMLWPLFYALGNDINIVQQWRKHPSRSSVRIKRTFELLMDGSLVGTAVRAVKGKVEKACVKDEWDRTGDVAIRLFDEVHNGHSNAFTYFQENTDLLALGEPLGYADEIRSTLVDVHPKSMPWFLNGMLLLCAKQIIADNPPQDHDGYVDIWVKYMDKTYPDVIKEAFK